VALGDDLDRLEASLRQLQVEWEKFFAGVERRAPTALQAKVDALIRQYAYADIRASTERFRYQSLAGRFSSFSELWNKRLRALEEGRPLGMHGLRAQVLPAPAATAAPSTAAPAAPAAAARPAPSEFRVADAARDATSVQALYERFTASRRETGEPAVKFETFSKLIAQQAQRLQAEKGVQAVDFRVETKDGKVSLKARPVK
jgi:hypothetical protein